MHTESFPSPDNQEDEITEQERLAWNHHYIREEANDLRTTLNQTPSTFPHRERLFEIADEILRLVPEPDQSADETDERPPEQTTPEK